MAPDNPDPDGLEGQIKQGLGDCGEEAASVS